MCDGNSQSAITLRLNRLAAARAGGWNAARELLPALRGTDDLSVIAARAYNGVTVARRSHEQAHIRDDFSEEQKDWLRAMLIEVIEDNRAVVYDWQPDSEHYISYRDSGEVLSITFHAPSDRHTHPAETSA